MRKIYSSEGEFMLIMPSSTRHALRSVENKQPSGNLPHRTRRTRTANQLNHTPGETSAGTSRRNGKARIQNSESLQNSKCSISFRINANKKLITKLSTFSSNVCQYVFWRCWSCLMRLAKMKYLRPLIALYKFLLDLCCAPNESNYISGINSRVYCICMYTEA